MVNAVRASGQDVFANEEREVIPGWGLEALGQTSVFTKLHVFLPSILNLSS